MPNLSWVEEDEQQAYLDAFRELVLPQTEVLVGSHQTLDRLPAARLGQRAPRLAARARGGGRRTRHALRARDRASPLPDQFLDNVLASPQGAITGEKFERFEVSFVGAGDTLVRRAGRAAGRPAPNCTRRSARRWPSSTRRWTRASAPAWATSIPDRFFWALPPGEEDEEAAGRRRKPTDDADAPEEPAPCPLTRRQPRQARNERRLFERAQRVIPGGVNSPVRAFRAVGGTPRFIARAQGAVPVRRRRPALHRLHRLLGPDDPRPRPPGRARGGAAGRRRRPVASARRPSARSSSPKRSSRSCPASSRCAWSAPAPRRR